MKKFLIRFVPAFVILAAIGLFYWPGYINLHRPYLTVIGRGIMADGIGRQAIELIDALHEDVDIGFIPVSKCNFIDIPTRIHRYIKKPNLNLGKVVIYENSLPPPHKPHDGRVFKTLKIPKNDEQIRIAYSMIESSRIPQKWTEILNTYFDAVAVPDVFLVEVYKNSGVEIPVFVVPLGLDITHLLNEPLKQEKHTPFRFINVSAMQERKNHEGLIRAFHAEFGNDPNVELCINYRSGNKKTIAKVQAVIASLHVDNIILTNEKLDNQKYKEWISQGDALVSLSMGEGFSIQPREAMALGLPVIIADNTAHATIIASGLVHKVPCPTTQMAYNDYLRTYCGQEYLADLDEARKAMRYVYENYDECLKNSMKGRNWVEAYQFKNMKPLYLSLIKPSKVILGEKDEVKEGILVTSSKELYQKYTKLLKCPGEISGEIAEKAKG